MFFTFCSVDLLACLNFTFPCLSMSDNCLIEGQDLLLPFISVDEVITDIWRSVYFLSNAGKASYQFIWLNSKAIYLNLDLISWSYKWITNYYQFNMSLEEVPANWSGWLQKLMWTSPCSSSTFPISVLWKTSRSVSFLDICQPFNQENGKQLNSASLCLSFNQISAVNPVTSLGHLLTLN